MSLTDLFVLFLVIACAYWGTHRIAKAAGMPDLVVAACDVLLLLLALWGILGLFGVVAPPPLRIR